MVFVLATGTIMNASSTNEEVILTSSETIEIVEDFGCASDCNSAAREGARAMSSDQEDTSSSGELMEKYKEFYGSCYDANC